MTLEAYLLAAALGLGLSSLGVAFILYRLLGHLQNRVSRVTQHLAEESAEHSVDIQDLLSDFAEVKGDAQRLIAEAEKLIVLANARVTDARGAYGDAQLMRDNAMRRIEKWDGAMAPLVDAVDKFKDRSDRKMAVMRKDLDGVISAQAASAGALTSRLKALEKRANKEM